MSEGEQSPEGAEIVGQENYVKIGVITLIAIVILTVITIGAYSYAKKRSGTTVLPGGTTYLGPPKTEETAPVTQTPPTQKFTAESTVNWIDFKGKINPFTFSYPETLKLVAFPNDPTESIGYAWANNPPQNNILFRINDLNKTEPTMAQYIGRPKKEYVTNWWKQYTGGLKGVKSVTEFTNSQGMKGYKAKFINLGDQTPNDDIFFEIPGRNDLMVRFGNGWLDTVVFDKIVDTFVWTGKSAAAEPTGADEAPVTPPAQ